MTELNKFQVSGKLKVVKGSVLNPQSGGLSFVLSTLNMMGKVDQNLLIPFFNKKWKKVASENRGFFAEKTGSYKLGAVFSVQVQSDVSVQNMLCFNDKLELDDKALEKCLDKVCATAIYDKASIHISSKLVEQLPQLPDMIKSHFLDKGVNVYMYEEAV